MRVIVSGVLDLNTINKFVEAGVEAFAFDFSVPNQRQEHLRELIRQLPPLTHKIGYFQQAPKYVVEEIVTFCKLDFIAFGPEATAEDYSRFSRPVIKHLAVLEELQWDWLDKRVSLLEIPLAWWQSGTVSFAHVIAKVTIAADLQSFARLKPYGINLEYGEASADLTAYYNFIKYVKCKF